MNFKTPFKYCKESMAVFDANGLFVLSVYNPGKFAGSDESEVAAAIHELGEAVADNMNKGMTNPNFFMIKTGVNSTS